MIPDWKLEKYLTHDLSENEMQEISELESKDEIFAGRVKMFREDSKGILHKMPFDNLWERLESMPSQKESYMQNSLNRKNSRFNILNFAKMVAAFVLCVGILFSMSSIFANNSTENVKTMDVSMLDSSVTRIKGMDVRMEVWKKTENGIVQMENLSNAHEGDEIQLRYLVPQKCFGLLFSMDGNGTITIHMGDNANSIELESGKMNTLPFAYKLDNAPYFEKFFFLTSQNKFSIDVNNIDKVLKQEGIQVASITLRKNEEDK